MKIKKRYYPLLLVMPVMMALTAVFLNDARGPYWLGSNSDPEYVYLLNAANLAGLKGVGHIDHPGTPVQVLGAVTIRLVHFFNFSPGIDWHTDVLQRPEYYLKAINIVLMVLNVLTLLALGMFTYFLTNNIWLSFWLQLSPFFSITLLQFGLTRVTPEPLLFFSSSSMIAVLVFAWKAHSDNLTTPGENVIMIFIFGIITGFGTACKVTFIPLAVIPLILFPKSGWHPQPKKALRAIFRRTDLCAGASRILFGMLGIKKKIVFFASFFKPLIKVKNKILFIFAAVLSFVIFTLPIIRMYPRFFDWIFNLLTHSGHYGGGAAALISTGKYFKNIKDLLAGNPFFAIILVLALAIVVITLLIPRLRKTHCPMIRFKLLAAVTAAQLTGLLMVSKHSAHHYLLPVLNLSGLAFFLIFLYFKHLLDQYNVTPKILTASTAIFLVFLFFLANPVGKLNMTISRLTKLKEQSLAVHQAVKNNYKDYVKIFYYGSSSPEYALKFGNDLSRSYHSEPLEKLYKSVYFYDIWTKRFTGFNYNEAIPFETIREEYGDKIVFQGPGRIKAPGFQLKKVSGHGFHEGIFVIE